MSTSFDYVLDVLGTSPEEIGSITTRLKQPSFELLDWAAKRVNRTPDEIDQDVTNLVGFKFAKNLFILDESMNKARRFKNSFKNWAGVVNSHIFEVSAEFPNAVFLLNYYADNYSGKRVIHAGEVVQDIFDGNQQAQFLDWVLLDIFAPFKAEWDRGLPFGSLWTKWLEDAKKQLEELGKANSQVVGATA